MSDQHLANIHRPQDEVLDGQRRPSIERLVRVAVLALDFPIGFVVLDAATGPELAGHFNRADSLAQQPSVAPGPAFDSRVLDDFEGTFISALDEDPRFASSPWVVGEPHLRTAFGMPIHGTGEEVLGVLWVADVVGRSAPGDRELELVRALAQVVGDEVRLLHSLADAMAGEGRAHAAIDRKQRVTAGLSHDLRTPLTAILGFGELLRLEQLTEDGTEALGHVLSSGRKLLVMIDEVLDVDKLDLDEQPVLIEALSVLELAKVARLAQESSATGRGVRVLIDESCTRRVKGDKLRLQRTLINLLGTVIERAREGATIHVIAAATNTGEVQVVLGPQASLALASNHLEDDDTLSDKRAGIVVAREFLAAMEGSVGTASISSASGAPTFWIRLPGAESTLRAPRPATDLSAVEAPVVAPPAVATPTLRGPADEIPQVDGVRRVLYIEDDPGNQRLMTKMFSNMPDVEVLSAVEGGLGLERAFKESPHVILLDLGLPDIGGREVLARLREDERTKGLPIVVLSGEAELERAQELLAAGATAYMTKPFQVRELLDSVVKLLASTSE